MAKKSGKSHHKNKKNNFVKQLNKQEKKLKAEKSVEELKNGDNNKRVESEEENRQDEGDSSNEDYVKVEKEAVTEPDIEVELVVDKCSTDGVAEEMEKAKEPIEFEFEFEGIPEGENEHVGNKEHKEIEIEMEPLAAVENVELEVKNVETGVGEEMPAIETIVAEQNGVVVDINDANSDDMDEVNGENKQAAVKEPETVQEQESVHEHTVDVQFEPTSSISTVTTNTVEHRNGTFDYSGSHSDAESDIDTDNIDLPTSNYQFVDDFALGSRSYYKQKGVYKIGYKEYWRKLNQADRFALAFAKESLLNPRFAKLTRIEACVEAGRISRQDIPKTYQEYQTVKRILAK